MDSRYNDMVRQRQLYRSIKNIIIMSADLEGLLIAANDDSVTCCVCASYLQKSVIPFCFLQAVSSIAHSFFYHSKAVRDRETEVSLLAEWPNLSESLKALLALNLGHDFTLRWCLSWEQNVFCFSHLLKEVTHWLVQHNLKHCYMEHECFVRIVISNNFYYVKIWSALKISLHWELSIYRVSL